MAQLDEMQLVDKARRGDAEALGDLLARHQRRIYNVCLRMVSNRDDAAELAQDAMLKIIQHIGDFQGNSRIGTWMIRIAMNLSISHLRKRKLRKAASLEASADADAATLRQQLADQREPGPASRVQEAEQVVRLQEALARIDDDFRAVIVLRDLDLMDYLAIAETLSIPVGTVKSRLFRGRLALRQEMEKVATQP